MASNVSVSKLTGLLIGSFIATQIINDIANSVNTTGNTILAVLVGVGKYILMAVVIMYAVKQVE